MSDVAPGPRETDQAADSPAQRRWLAHHFESPAQQSAAAKLGIWIFLVTEILFFSGLFCAYAVYRRNHPEIFLDGHLLLDTKWGAINTAVLIFSSLTMALAVRAAQCGQRRALIGLLAVTIACGFGFLGIKYVEYKAKWDHQLVPGQARIAYFCRGQYFRDLFGAASGTATAVAPPRGVEPDLDELAHLLQHGSHGAQHQGLTKLAKWQLQQRGNNIRTFVGIYFAMTGLHGLHVSAGIGVLLWILVRAWNGHFSSQYFNPVDCTGLYWHLVDLIWIYLFPLLYLIH